MEQNVMEVLLIAGCDDRFKFNHMILHRLVERDELAPIRCTESVATESVGESTAKPDRVVGVTKTRLFVVICHVDR